MALESRQRRLQSADGGDDRGRQIRWRGRQGEQTSLQAGADRIENADVGQHLAFWPLTQALGALLVGLGGQRIEQQLRGFDHLLAHRSRSVLILVELGRQLPGDQRRRAQTRQ